MKLSQLKGFISICECGSVTAAAESLHISQPSLSVMIQELEAEFGLLLFSRGKRRLILTDEGKEFLQNAIEIVSRTEKLEERMKWLGRNTKNIRLGVPSMASVFLYSKLIAAFNEKYPFIRVEMSETGGREAEQLVREGRLDMAILNYVNELPDLFTFTPIMETTLMGCVAPGHPLAGKKDVTIEMLKDERLILFGRDAKTTQCILRAFEQEGLDPNVFMLSKQIYLIMQLVKKYGAVSFFMDELMKMQDDLAPFYFAAPVCFTFGIIQRKDIHLSIDMLKFLRFCERFDKEKSRH